MPRIAPLAPPYAPEIDTLLRKWMPPDATDIEPLALFRTLAVHPELMSRMLPLGAGILGHPTVSPREREIVIHRVCARAGAEYEWGVHAVVFASRVGITSEQLTATAIGDAHDAAWDADDALLVRLADELHDVCQVSDEVWDGLRERFSDAQVLELVITAGWYRLLAGVINAAGVPLEPWAARFPAHEPLNMPGV
jgi:alkylhydroperoxidase family enzyme